MTPSVTQIPGIERRHDEEAHVTGGCAKHDETLRRPLFRRVTGSTVPAVTNRISPIATVSTASDDQARDVRLRESVLAS